MSTLTVSREYSALLKKVPPKVSRTERENDMYTEILYDLDRRGKTLTPAEKEMAELLTLLIKDFEKKRYQLPRAKPLEALRFLIEQHGLSTFLPNYSSSWRSFASSSYPARNRLCAKGHSASTHCASHRKPARSPMPAASSQRYLCELSVQIVSFSLKLTLSPAPRM